MLVMTTWRYTILAYFLLLLPNYFNMRTAELIFLLFEMTSIGDIYEHIFLLFEMTSIGDIYDLCIHIN